MTSTLLMFSFGWAMLTGAIMLGLAIGASSDVLERYWWFMFPLLWPLLVLTLVVRWRLVRRREVMEASRADQRLREAIAALNQLDAQTREAIYDAVLHIDTTHDTSNVANSATASLRAPRRTRTSDRRCRAAGIGSTRTH